MRNFVSLIARIVACELVLLLLLSPVKAETVLGNVSQPSFGFGLGVGTNNPPALGNLKRAQGFRTGSNAQGYHLNSVTLGLGGSMGAGLGNFALELHQVDAFDHLTTTTHLNGFLVTQPPTVEGLHTFQFFDPSLVLLPATRYLIVARSPESSGPTVSQYGWRQADGIDASSLPGWQISGPFVDSEGESSWFPLRASSHQFSVDATIIVPEPCSIYLACTLASWMVFLSGPQARKRR